MYATTTTAKTPIPASASCNIVSMNKETKIAGRSPLASNDWTNRSMSYQRHSRRKPLRASPSPIVVTRTCSAPFWRQSQFQRPARRQPGCAKQKRQARLTNRPFINFWRNHERPEYRHHHADPFPRNGISARSQATHDDNRHFFDCQHHVVLKRNYQLLHLSLRRRDL